MAKILSLFILFASLCAEDLPIVDCETWVVLDIEGAIDPEVAPVVQKFQHSAGAVFGLTALQPPVNAAILKELALIGIDFTFTAPARPNLETKAPVRWEGGVLFISDFNRKAEVFRKWLEMAQFRPSKIVIIDTGNQPKDEIEKQMSQIEIPCRTFHFIRKFRYTDRQ
ncbi:MAG: DUF2608 domain-containing protein [Parachlamydiales bacterium]|nr:DUF2608 domain-containing protein [Parachlamydiales bacterium]